MAELVFAQKPSPSHVLLSIWLIWLDNLIKGEILMMTGMGWPVRTEVRQMESTLRASYEFSQVDFAHTLKT